MAANAEVIQSSPKENGPRESCPRDIALDMAAQMEELSENGEWVRVQAIAARMCDVLLQVPEGERRQLVTAVRRSTDKVNAQASYAKREVVEKLTAIRNGQTATKAYKNADLAGSPG